MRQPVARSRFAWLVAAGVALPSAACQDDLVTSSDAVRVPGERSSAVVPVDYTKLVAWTPPRDANGVYLLPKACDVLIGQPADLVGTADMPSRYAHQLLVSVPEGAQVKLVNKADHPDVVFPAYPSDNDGDGVSDGAAGLFDDRIDIGADGLRTFRCSAADPTITEALVPVVEPNTDHAGKGDGPQIHTNGVTFDLNGFGVRALPSATDLDPNYDNLGIVVGGSGVTLTNSYVLDPEKPRAGVAFLDGFGHKIDIEADNPTVRGQRWLQGDGSYLYNIETTGGVGARGSSGTVLIEAVKSVDEDLVLGQGFEIRRCATGSTSIIRNSHFMGAAEGAFIRECAGVTLESNFISAPNGTGVATREAWGTADFPNVIRNNVIWNASRINSEVGIHLSDRQTTNVQISGNQISGFQCGVQIMASNATLPTPTALAANNVINTNPQVCDGNFVPVPGDANDPPVADFTVVCTGLTCTFTNASTDPDGTVSSWSWNFGAGTASTATGVGPHTFTYAAAGSYTVTLRATDNEGAQGESVQQVNVSPPANLRPVASFVVTGCVETTFTCTFDGTGSRDPDGTVAQFNYDFGDGRTTYSGPNGLQPMTYRAAGLYTVRLAVRDNTGALSDTVSQQVLVPGPITITGLTASVRRGTASIDLRWTGAVGTQARVHRTDLSTGITTTLTVANTTRDGRLRETVTSARRYRYQVCNTAPSGVVSSANTGAVVCSATRDIQT